MSIAVSHSQHIEPGATDWPRLKAADVRAVVDRWGFPDAEPRVVWHSARPLSAAAIVQLSDRQVFVKRHHRSVRSAPELSEEHRFIEHLRAHGAPVSPVLSTADGASAVQRGDWTYEIHGVGAGVDLYRDVVSWAPLVSYDHATAAGRALASLHASSRGFEAPLRSASLLVSNDQIIRSPDPIGVIRDLIDRRPALRDYFQGKNWQVAVTRAIAPFHERLLAALPQLQSLWTHNDWHASNLLWSDGSAAATVQTVLDFGLSDRTTAVYDLATAIERNTIPWLDIHAGVAGAANSTLVSGLIRGYLSEAPLSSIERTALSAILPLVHVGYALSEVDYFYGTTHSVENADLAYHGFLLGHRAWFETAPGRALLDHVDRELQELP